MSNGQPITVNKLLRACYTAFLAAGVFSFAVNLLMLTLPIFMFQVFDRVLASRSESTLFLLLLIATVALSVQAGLDAIRAYAFVRISGWIDRRVGPLLLSSIIIEALERGRAPNSNPLRSLDTLRMFLTGPGMLTMLDVPWVPIFLMIIFWINPAMGWAAVAGAIVMFVLGILNDRMTRPALNEAREYSGRAYQAAEAAVRNAAVVESMGMRRNILSRWRRENEQVLTLQSRASDRAAVFQAISKSVRMFIQMVIMTVAVTQIIDPDTAMTPGAMIACSLILGRALQPVEQGISQARQLIDALSAYRVVESTLQSAQSRHDRMSLPPPTGMLSVENIGFQPRGVPKPILQRISFEVAAGEVLGIIGPSAAGKSTLARLLVGVEKPTVGHVRLDGADAYSWDPDDLGQYVGFMPQDTELFAGTVADNISRLAENADPQRVIDAAKLAGLHDMVLRLPNGYDTDIGNAGAILSGGQRQRVALARALYGDPKILVLDEPNSNLDASGDEALLTAIEQLRDRGTTVILITHRPQTLVAVDQVMVLQNGTIQTIGPRDEVLGKLGGAHRAPGPGGQLEAPRAALPKPSTDGGSEILPPEDKVHRAESISIGHVRDRGAGSDRPRHAPPRPTPDLPPIPEGTPPKASPRERMTDQSERPRPAPVWPEVAKQEQPTRRPASPFVPRAVDTSHRQEEAIPAGPAPAGPAPAGPTPTRPAPVGETRETLADGVAERAEQRGGSRARVLPPARTAAGGRSGGSISVDDIQAISARPGR